MNDGCAPFLLTIIRTGIGGSDLAFITSDELLGLGVSGRVRVAVRVSESGEYSLCVWLLVFVPVYVIKNICANTHLYGCGGAGG